MRNIAFLFCFLICALSILIGCSSNKNVDRTLSTAYALLNDDPDSALHILSKIDKNSLSASVKARYALIYTIAQDKSGIDVKDDSLLSIARAYYDKREGDTLYGKFCYYQGLSYVLQDSLKQAESYLYRSIQASECSGDKYTEYLACFQMSRVLDLRDMTRSLIYSKKALEIYESMNQGNVTNKILLIRNVGTCYDYLGIEDSAMIYMKKALALAQSADNNQLIGTAFHSISQIYQSMGKPDSALHYAKQAWNISLERDPSLYAHLGSCYIAIDSLRQAECFLKEGAQLSSRFSTKYVLYNNLLKISLLRTNNSEAQVYSDSAQAILKRIFYSSESDNASYVKENHDLEEQRNEMEDTYNRTVFFTIILVLLFGLIILVILITYYSSRKTAKLKAEIEQKKYEQDLKLCELKLQNQLEIERVKFQNEEEKQKLVAENKERQLSLMKRYFMSKMNQDKPVQEIKDALKVNDLKDNDWLEVEIFLNETFSDYVTRFRKIHPDLVETDIRDCMLLKMGLSNPDLSRYYGISLPSVKQRLLRLKNKLSIDENAISAREYIESF